MLQTIEQGISKLELNLLPTVLNVQPRRRWAELAGSRIDLDMVFDTPSR